MVRQVRADLLSRARTPWTDPLPRADCPTASPRNALSFRFAPDHLLPTPPGPSPPRPLGRRLSPLARLILADRAEALNSQAVAEMVRLRSVGGAHLVSPATAAALYANRAAAILMMGAEKPHTPP